MKGSATITTRLLAAALLAAGSGAWAAAPGAQGQPALVHPSPELAAVDLRAADVRFLLDAVAANVTELRAGAIALERSQEPAVREFAQRIVQDHAQANMHLLQIAREMGVAVPREPSEGQRGMLAGLRGVPDRVFDREFLQRAGVAAHQHAIGVFHAEVVRPDPDRALKRFAEDQLPVLQQHLRMAQAMLAHPDTAS